MQTFEQLSSTYVQDFIIVSDTIFLSVGVSGSTFRSLNYGTTWEDAGIGGASFFEATFFNGKIYAMASKGIDYVTTPDQLLDPVVNFEAAVTDNVLTITDLSENLGTKLWTIGDISVSGDLVSYNLPVLGDYDITLTGTNTVAEVTSDPVQVTVDTIASPWATTNYSDQTLAKLTVIKKDTSAVIIGNNTTVLYTNDGGKNWLPAQYPDSLYGHMPNSVCFFNDNTGIASFSYSSGKLYPNGFILRTVDGGATWTPIPLSVFDNGEASETNNPVLGNKIYFYSMAVTGTDTALVIIKYVDSSALNHAFVYKSKDQGLTWECYPTDLCLSPVYTSGFNGMEFDQSGKTGYMIGIKKFWKTTNYGEYWNPVDATDLGSINDLLVLDENTVFMATQNGTAKSTDGMSTYAINPTDYSFDVIEIAENIIVTGKDEVTFKVSTDGGDTWELNASGMDNFFELSLFNNEVLAFGSTGKVYHANIDNFLPVAADFDYSVNDLTITLTNKSTGGDPTWDFGDGNSSDETDPVHTYTAYDTYDVSQTVANLCKTRTYSVSVDIVDEINPVIENCPDNISATITSGTTVEVSWTAPTASDNSGTVDLTSNYNPGDQFGVGTWTVVYTATDEAGNEATCSFEISVIDGTGIEGTNVPSVGLYPNPSGGKLVYLQPANMASGTLTVEVISIDGKIVMNSNIEYIGSEIPLEMNIGKGLYQVRITDNEGRSGISKMVVY